MLGLKMLKSKKTISQDEFDKQILPSTPNKELTFSGTHMAFVDPAVIQSISSMHINVTTIPKDPNFVAEKDLYKDVTDKPSKPAQQLQMSTILVMV